MTQQLNANTDALRAILVAVNKLPDAESGSGGTFETCEGTVESTAPTAGDIYVCYMDQYGQAIIETIGMAESITIQAVKNTLVYILGLGDIPRVKGIDETDIILESMVQGAMFFATQTGFYVSG